jgi:branched-chain amino acid transport system substrate-binding protein
MAMIVAQHPAPRPSLSRRQFLRTAAIAGAGSLVAFPVMLRAQDKVLTIAGIHSLTGPAQAYGKWADEGARLAIEEMKPQLQGWTIKYILFDDQTNAGVAVRKAREAIDSGADHLDGPELASSATAVAPIAREHKITMTTGTGQSELFGKDCNRYVFKWNATNFTQVRTPVIYAMEQFPKAKQGKWAVLTADYNWGHQSRQHFLDYLQEKNLRVEVVEDAKYDLKTTDFTPFLTKVLAKRPDVFFLIGIGGTETINALKQAHQLGLKRQMPIVWTLGQLNAYRAVGSAVVEGTVSELLWWQTLDIPASKEFVARYKKAYGGIPDWFAAVGYSNMKIYLTAVKQVGAKEASATIKAMESYEGEGLTGRERMNPDTHVVDKPFYAAVGKKEGEKQDADDWITLQPPPPLDEITWTKERAGCVFQEKI